MHGPPGMSRLAIELRGVEKSFEGIPVLRGVDLEVPEGETLVLLGASGSGKTVLLRLIIGLLKPDRGQVIVDGEDIPRLPEASLQAHWRKLGILFQSGALFDSLTVYENVAFPLRERLHLKERAIREKVLRALSWVDLAGTEARLPGELSGGMQKRVAFARAVVQEPRILLYDEPTGGLDPVTTHAVTDVILRGREALGSTGFIITSDLSVAFRLADRMAFLHEGRILEEATPDALKESAVPEVQAFLHLWHERTRIAAGGLPAS